jgi:hypothetical protein
MVACGSVVESRLQAAVRLCGPSMHLEVLAIPDVNSGRVGLVACSGLVEVCVALAVLPHGTGFSTCISRRIPANSGRIGVVVMRGKRHRRGPLCSCHPSRILCPSGWMTDTAVLVNTIWQPRLAKGPKPIRVWGNDGMTCPCIDAGGRDGAEARVALATDFSGRPFATQTATVGAFGSRLGTSARSKIEATGTRVGNASVGRWKLGGIASRSS